ncbi:MAG: acyloxyacyl hydrolase [Bacteroidetes bacterium]|nr:acyloxyacyl hydrolase [Bacteroidota bacterium]
MRAAFISILSFLGISSSVAQESFHFALLPGYLMPHSVSMPHMAAHSIGGEFAWQFSGLGNQYADSLYKQIDWGFSLYYNYLNKHEINGSTIAIIPYVQILIKKHKHSSSQFRLGAGLGYCTQIFNPLINPKNRAMSSRLNGSMQIVLINKRPLSQNTGLFYGIGMTHFSNANFNRPNLGINTPQINIGLNFGSSNSKQYRFKTDTSKIYTQSYLETRVGFASKTATISDPTRRPVYTLALTQGIGITPIRSARVGLDFYYDKLDPYIVFNPDSKDNFKFKDAFETAIKAGYEYYFGKITFYLDLGYYLYKPEHVGKLDYYISIGLNYNYKKFFVGTRLKSHAANADFVDWCIGYRFDSNYLKRKNK